MNFMKSIILIILVILSFNSCKKEDVNQLIIGKWQVENHNWFYTYNEDKTFYTEDKDTTSGGIHLAVYSGNYKIDNNVLYYFNSSIGSADISEKIISCDGSTLILKAAVEYKLFKVE